ncbi:NGG1 interacting factor [Chamberlinius hualienensis]
MSDAGANMRHGLILKDVIRALERWAPLNLAEKWDNVGLLLEPSEPILVNRMMLTNDLTEEVCSEAISKDVNLILSYHPPLFAPVKKLTRSHWKERCAIRCIENKIAVYSPHTCWDALSKGVNDWLALAFKPIGIEKVEPIINSYEDSEFTHLATLTYENAMSDPSKRNLEKLSLNHLIGKLTNIGERVISFPCNHKALSALTEIKGDQPAASINLTQLEKLPLEGVGMGRVVTLKEATTLEMCSKLIQAHLKLTHLRLALGSERSISESSVRRVALCAGSGSSVLSQVAADLYWTGEMGHHQVLEAVARGVSVILCEHSNTERGFLPHIQNVLQTEILPQVEIIVSKTDRDPFIIV